MEIIVAKTAGFCFGVNRAVKGAYQLLEEGEKVVTLGPLIHNPQCVADLAAKGAAMVNTPAEVPAGYGAVIRSHGVGETTYEELAALGVKVHNLTCPFVTKIHKIAKRETAAGRTLLIAGDAAHAEVVAIIGHAAGPVYTFADESELSQLSAAVPFETSVAIVAQTTFEVTKWQQCMEFVKKHYTNASIFDTICNATWVRQDEAAALSARCDAMVVVGGRHSSNTQKLLSICQKGCRATLVETAGELNPEFFHGCCVVGVTAGASTPAHIIEEVLTRMSDMLQEEEMSFEQMLEESLKPAVFRGKKIKGVVTGFSPSEVTIDIGTKHTGFIPLSELSDEGNGRPEDYIKIGQELDLVVTQVNDQEGIVMLSKKRFDSIAGFEDVQKAAEDGSALEAYISEQVKGGLVAMVKGVRIFIPASQASARRGDDLATLVKTKQPIKILEISGRRAIGSIRAVLSESSNEAKEKFWAEAEVGKHYKGTIKSLTSYGAFVDLGGVDGLVHISELAWNRIKHPSEVVSVGDVIEVYIKDINNETKKVSLGFKKSEDNPWEKLKNAVPIGTIVKGPVVSLTKFGAFVRVLPGIDGLVHVSEIARERIEKASDVLEVGQEVEVQLIDVDYDRKRVSLSMKALTPELEGAEGEPQNSPETEPANTTPAVEDTAPATETAEGETEE